MEIRPPILGFGTGFKTGNFCFTNSLKNDGFGLQTASGSFWEFLNWKFDLRFRDLEQASKLATFALRIHSKIMVLGPDCLWIPQLEIRPDFRESVNVQLKFIGK